MAAEHLIPYQKRWAKGQSGNPTGGTKLPPELRAIQALSQPEMARLVAKYARMSPTALEAMVEAKQAPMLELVIARIFQEAAKAGDDRRLSFLLDRAIGKVQALEPETDETAAIREIENLSDQDLIKLVKDKLPALEKTPA